MRTFISIDIPEKIREEIALVSREFSGEGITMVKTDALHLSIHFLGDLTEQGINKVKESMKEISAEEFEVGIKGIDFFTPNFIKVIFARISAGEAQCSDIYEQLGRALVSRGFELEPGKYTPHVTLARVKRVKNPAALVLQIRSHAETEFGSFMVKSIKLKSSELTGEGPVYTDLYKLDL
ncbi:MAG: RNA 2',3'-cyclic phosphodiesterase [Candidatus Micrarchaeota archaeon]|nr:RNA 2',3'-cyclic phosphodiesterase [Candidatus Micrarchaeota archaeon]